MWERSTIRRVSQPPDRSREELPTDVLPRLRPRRYGEDRAAGELEVLHHRVVARHRRLQWDEVPAGVADVGDEEEPGVETAEGVGTVDEVVAASQHPGAVV